jgi:putative Mn2+ efflux pump MntP
VARLVALTVALFVATFAVSARQRLRISLLVPIAAPVLGLLAGLGLGRALGGPADYPAALVLVTAAAFLLADDDVDPWAWIGLGLSIGLGIGLLRPPFVPAVIMIGVQALAATSLGLVLGSAVDSRIRVHAQHVAALAVVAIGIYIFLARLAG